ncbi:unnamed protein product [Rotaria socialis]
MKPIELLLRRLNVTQLLQTRVSEKTIYNSIANQQIDKFIICVRQSSHSINCLRIFFELLPTLTNDNYVFELVEVLNQSPLTSDELSTTTTKHLCHLLSDKYFDRFEQILHLPFRSFSLTFSIFQLMEFIRQCTDFQQLIRCLTILINRHIPHANGYPSWILQGILARYRPGDEKLIESLLKIKTNVNILYIGDNNTGTTPFMLLMRLCTNEKCLPLIDEALSNIKEPTLMNYVDNWDRSYLSYLLCAVCEHKSINVSQQNTEESFSSCPNAQAVLRLFAQLWGFGNRCSYLIQTILNSQFCFSLRLALFDCVLKFDSSASVIKENINTFFTYFPSIYIPQYSTYLKRLALDQSLNQALLNVLEGKSSEDRHLITKIKFLLQQGSRIEPMKTIPDYTRELLLNSHSPIPFLLLDYAIHMEIPDTSSTNQINIIVNLYVRHLAEWGYRQSWQTYFDQYQSTLLPATIDYLEKIRYKIPQHLSTLCIQRSRSLLINLGDNILEKLGEHLSHNLIRSLTRLAYDQHYSFFCKVSGHITT